MSWKENAYGMKLKYHKNNLETSKGDRQVFCFEPSDAFWEAWNEDKDAMKGAGWAVSKYQGNWQATFWAPAGKDPDATDLPQPVDTYEEPEPEDCPECGTQTALGGMCDRCQKRYMEASEMRHGF